MSVIQHEDYLAKLKSSQQDFKVETLQVHRKFLYSLFNHHQLWATNTDNPEIAAIHIIAANSIRETIHQYNQILARYSLDNWDLSP